MQMRNPEVSVLTCCYNASAFIKEAIESILRQSYQDFECIIVDNNSTDSTPQVLEYYAQQDKRIKVIKEIKPNLADARNAGLKIARGKWIAVLDADDIALPDRLELQLNFIRKNKGIVLLGGGCIEIDKESSIIKKHIYPQGHNALMSRLEAEKAFFPHSSSFFNKEAVVKLGSYNNKFLRSIDCDLWLRIGEIALMTCLRTPVVKLRKHSQMISNTGQGRLQIIMGACAVICHFRRKWGLSDPSRLDEGIWKKFLKWIEKRMETEGYFCLIQRWRDFRSRWYADIEANKFKKYKSAFKELAEDPLTRKAFWNWLQNSNFVLKLAEESKRLSYL